MSNAGGVKSLNRYFDMLAGNTTWNPWAPAGAYEPLAVATVPVGGLAAVSFGGIPQTYAHLQVRAFAKNNDGNPFGSVAVTINGGAGEARHDLYGTGSVVGVSGIGQSLYAYIGGTAQFGAFVLDILDYSSTNKSKTGRALCGVDNSGSGLVAFTSGLTVATTAVTSLTITSSTTNSLLSQYSTFALYGIKG